MPADGFYEWAKDGAGRQPYCIRRQGHDDKKSLFAFAGIWETAHDPEGGEIDTVAILTAAAGPDIKSLHHREPVVVDPADFSLWLDADERDLAMLSDVTASSCAGFWAHHEISTAVNSVRNDGPYLLEPEQELPLFA